MAYQATLIMPNRPAGLNGLTVTPGRLRFFARAALTTVPVGSCNLQYLGLCLSTGCPACRAQHSRFRCFSPVEHPYQTSVAGLCQRYDSRCIVHKLAERAFGAAAKQVSNGMATAETKAAGSGPPSDADRSREDEFRRRDILRWVYLTRIGLAGGLFVGAVLAWSAATPGQTLAASLALVITLILTPVSYWFTHVGRGRANKSFVYAQAIFDVLLVTLVVHVTGGRESVVAPLYILLISGYALMLPLRGGFLVAAMGCMAYVADVVWGQGAGIDTVVVLQVLIFVAVALVVGLISTKLKQAGVELTSVERALEQLRLQTDDILENIPSAVFTVDGEGRLAYANEAAEALLGIEAHEWTDRPVMEEIGRRSAGLRKVLERTRTYQIPVAGGEVEVVLDGESVPVGITTSMLERPDSPPSVTAIMRDISDRKRIESLRRRTERLEAVAELSASLAHEIKNPLASISSSVQQLGLSEGADEDDQLLSKLVLKESDRLSRLLSDFIEFARLHVERLKEFDLRDAAGHALNVVRQHPSYREEIELELDVEDSPVLIKGDEDLIHRVITNLVLNAMQAATPGSAAKVEVLVRREHPDCVLSGLEVLNPVFLRVSDNGPGIAQADLKRIFDPFFSKRRGGTGLGLAIVHRVVQEHGGNILVSSDPEKGSRFTICLPAEGALQSEAE